MSWWLLNAFKDGDSTIALGNLCQCLLSLPVTVFPDVWRESPLCQLVSVSVSWASVPVTGYHWEEPGSVLLALSLQMLIPGDEIRRAASSPRLKGHHSSPSLSSLERYSLVPLSSLWPFAGLSPACSCLPYSAGYGGPELSTAPQVWPEQRAGIPTSQLASCTLPQNGSLLL